MRREPERRRSATLMYADSNRRSARRRTVPLTRGAFAPVGTGAAIVWVLMIDGVVLVARVLVLSWLRQRHLNRRQ